MVSRPHIRLQKIKQFDCRPLPRIDDQLDFTDLSLPTIKLVYTQTRESTYYVSILTNTREPPLRCNERSQMKNAVKRMQRLKPILFFYQVNTKPANNLCNCIATVVGSLCFFLNFKNN